MKFAFCLYKHFPYSGLSRDMLRILQVCKQRRHQVDIFTGEWQDKPCENASVHVLPVRALTNHSRCALFHRHLRHALLGQKFDAVIGFNKMPGLDIYYGADYCYIGRAAPQYGHLYRLTPRFQYRHHFEKSVFGLQSKTRILSISEREKSVYQQFYLTPEERFHLLPPTLDPNRKLLKDPVPIRKETRQQLQLDAKLQVLLFIGSGFKTKGLDRAILALAGLPDKLRNNTRLLVIGEDNEVPFRKLARRYRVDRKVIFLGGRSDVECLLTAGDLLIHPAYHENTGTVLLEAITAGLPVLATDVCGYAPHIERANAGSVLHSPFEQSILNQRLLQMLESPQREYWQHNGLRYAQNGDLYQMPEAAMDQIEHWSTERQQADAANVHCQIDNHENLPINMYLRPDIRHALPEKSSLSTILHINGESVRKAPGRRTVKTAIGGKQYFLKAHFGVGWAEIFKNLSYLRLPVLGARNEWHGIHHLKRIGVDTLTAAGYGITGLNPARRQSFMLTEDLTDTISLEDFCRQNWVGKQLRGQDLVFKRSLINRLADIAHAIHSNGANHRDFYLCHFLLSCADMGNSNTPRVFLIDLHRMQIRRSTPKRWSIKDIAGLYYSSMDMGLSQRDLFRFMRRYRRNSLRQIIGTERLFWARVRRRAVNLYHTEQRKSAQLATSSVTVNPA
ncbi:MAG TPA: lipopolysaccharide core heptose(I) kinase RfaP [Gammaproteobacteria bacterium]|nr:lipopolysaccharide core heptose(I) kinase RfaP [Gammaproteobacteria bacterium]